MNLNEVKDKRNLVITERLTEARKAAKSMVAEKRRREADDG